MENSQESFQEKAKEYFDEKKYRTIIVGKDGYKSADDLKDAIDAVGEDNLSSEEREEILRHLKASNPKKEMLKAIDATKSNEKKAKLIAACWEIDMDCTDDFLFFVQLCCSDDFNVSLEALTVIENIDNAVKPEELSKARELVANAIKQQPENADLLADLLKIIKGKQ